LVDAPSSDVASAAAICDAKQCRHQKDFLTVGRDALDAAIGRAGDFDSFRHKQLLC
jgi:hypothetical protein